jgi:cytochrome oxidase assembly protein ShyY1
VGDYAIIYLLVGLILIVVAGIGMWQMQRSNKVSRPDMHSALTEIEEARHKMRP